ncbi:lysophospholipid acyltransferase family protein [Acidocella sp. KAb 2-4]|uniref:lysophospholipid acyltransferase family protein n=1 Tax=Acidocella sp. KAb 2-4 TaxID=2885158 RepID=UPI001D098810|nr:lysophospholipid acyltransferase family protein [Acidocella sp. KAb 2-4]MCB5943382.1 lysophospholipid acyltransferase family protein [Acidocella sp. KAb 2-4]
MSQSKVKLGHRLEAAIVWLLIRALRPLRPETASRIGGGVAAAIGPLIPTSRIADQNLRLAMPELDAAARQRIVRDCWRNLGQTAAELVCMDRIRETETGPGYKFIGWEENIAPALKNGTGGPSIFITGHIANWEITPPAAFTRGLDVGFMYRAASNPLVNEMILRLREANSGRKVTMFPKGGAGARAAYAHLFKGGHLGLLVDQKLDTGIAAPFFGHEAMTMDAMAAFALKFRCPVFPVHVVRVAPARLHIICEPPMPLPDTGDKKADTLALTTQMNQTLERWIREAPGAWLWLHRRWPKALYRR